MVPSLVLLIVTDYPKFLPFDNCCTHSCMIGLDGEHSIWIGTARTPVSLVFTQQSSIPDHPINPGKSPQTWCVLRAWLLCPRKNRSHSYCLSRKKNLSKFTTTTSSVQLGSNSAWWGTCTILHTLQLIVKRPSSVSVVTNVFRAISLLPTQGCARHWVWRLQLYWYFLLYAFLWNHFLKLERGGLRRHQTMPKRRAHRQKFSEMSKGKRSAKRWKHQKCHLLVTARIRTLLLLVR